MYVRREKLQENIRFPQGSAVAILGENVENFDELESKFRLVCQTAEDTRFAIVGENNDASLNAYKLGLKQIPFCISGSRPENVFLNDVLWNGTVPFIPATNFPEFIVLTNKSKKADLEFCARLVFAIAEKITMEILSKGYSETVFPLWFSQSDFLRDHEQEACELAHGVAGRIDGLKQAESALVLLRAKEKNEFNRSDAIVLLAKYLAKVYNYFIKYQPTTLFAPNNNMREDVLTEFFGVKTPNVRRIATEFEVRKFYYMMSHNTEILQSLWDNVDKIMDRLFLEHKMLTENNGFCLEEISDDAKFATFVSPDLLDGQTLLALIKDCGVADIFI
jgi:hypothetical protein